MSKSTPPPIRANQLSSEAAIDALKAKRRQAAQRKKYIIWGIYGGVGAFCVLVAIIVLISSVGSHPKKKMEESERKLGQAKSSQEAATVMAKPPDAIIESTIRKWGGNQAGGGSYFPISIIKVPQGLEPIQMTAPGIPGPLQQNAIFEHIRVVKSASPYQTKPGWKDGDWTICTEWPIRVEVKGTVEVRCWVVGASKGGRGDFQCSKRLPFEGIVDFTICFMPGNNTGLDPIPAKWWALGASEVPRKLQN